MIKRTCGGLLAALMLVLAAGIHPAAAQEDTCFQKGGLWDAAQQKCVITMTVDISLDYPIELANNPLIDSTVQQFFNDQRASFLGVFSDGFYTVSAPLSLQISYTTTPFLDQLLGLKFDIYTYTGGAHPNTIFTTFTFDLVQNRVLTLDDLFVPGSNPLAVIGPLVEQSLQAQLGDMTDASWIHTGTGDNPDNYVDWQLTADALVFYFPPYQVAAYATGPQSVSIPRAQIAGLLQSRFATPAGSGIG
jgi:hypothetical protein